MLSCWGPWSTTPAIWLVPSSAGVIMIEAKLRFCLAGDVMLGLTEAKEPRPIPLATVYGRFSSDRVKVVLLPRFACLLLYLRLATACQRLRSTGVG